MSDQRHRTDRRDFLGLASSAAAGTVIRGHLAEAAVERPESLAGVIGITTGGLNFQRENRILTAFTLPAFVRDELGMQLIDLNTRWMESFDRSYCLQVREAAEKQDCYFSNLKVNHKFGDLYGNDPNDRKRSMSKAQELIIAAATLGCRWIRFPVPKFVAGDDASKLDSHRVLAAFAKPHGIQLLVENGGWLSSDPDSIVRVVKAIGGNVAPGPDTGNWNNDVRYEALAKSFPGAATCDFKVFDLDENRRHEKYDIKRCFDVGWKAGFRGPWAIEHWNEDSKAFARETSWLRDELQAWMAAKTK